VLLGPRGIYPSAKAHYTAHPINPPSQSSSQTLVTLTDRAGAPCALLPLLEGISFLRCKSGLSATPLTISGASLLVNGSRQLCDYSPVLLLVEYGGAPCNLLVAPAGGQLGCGFSVVMCKAWVTCVGSCLC
jgi:hypothetical protein